MAAFNRSEMAAILEETFRPAFAEAVRKDAHFLQLLEKHQINYDAKEITWRVKKGVNTSARSYAMESATAFNTSGKQSYDKATLGWVATGGKIEVTGIAQSLSSSKKSPFALVAKETADLVTDMKRNVHLQLLSDGAGNLNGAHAELDNTGIDITGIQACIDDGSNAATYAGITRSASAWWKAYVNTSTTYRSLTEALMEDVINEIETRGGKVSHIFCGKNIFDTYGRILAADRRFVNPDGKYKGGFSVLYHGDIPIIKLNDYQAHQMDFVNIADFEYYVRDGVKIEARDAGAADAYVFIAKMYHQLAYKNPWKSGSLRMLT